MNSMTGFGRADGVIDDFHFTVESKSVNHRFLEVRYRLPTAFSSWEIGLGDLLRSQFERGAFEISVRSRLSAKKGSVKGVSRFLVDELALESLVKATKRVSSETGVAIAITGEMLLQSGRVFVATDEEKQVDVWRAFRPIACRALLGLSKMRAFEGNRLKTTLVEGMNLLEKIVLRLRRESEGQPAAIRNRVQERIAGWNLDRVDPQRLEFEVALLADKADVTEELDRLDHHLKAFHDSLKAIGPVGRKLDFLLQELNREVNTLGAKAALASVSQGSIEAKVLIEKLREQVQNVE